MGIEHTKDLLKFLRPFPSEVRDRALWLRKFVWNLYPDANELIYDNYNSVAFGWSVTDRVSHLFCTIAVGRTNHSVQFGFYFGARLSDPDKILLGQGNQYRYIVLADIARFPKTYMKRLLKESYASSLSNVKDKTQIMKNQTITKSISAVKRTKGAARKKK